MGLPPSQMIHAGEGDAGTGEVCRRPGTYRSLCCSQDLRVTAGERFPACPKCGEATDWTWIRA